MSRADRLESFAAGCRTNREAGHVRMVECAVCGWLDWRSTETKQPKGHSVETQAGCGRCREAFMREPEVAGWVLAALGKLREELAVAAPGASPAEGE